MSSNTNNGSISSYTIGSDNFTLTNLGTISTSAGSAVMATATGDTVVNAGTIRGATFGITASLGISVTNSGAGAVIYGGTVGVYGTGGTTAITNSASIGGGTYGIELKAAGTVSNASGGTITGGFAAIYLATAGTIINAGSIAVGVRMHGGSVLTNQSNGTITGAAAVSDYGGSTVVNYGHILSSTATDFHQGVDLGQNSLLINHTAGLITGYFGAAVDLAGTVVNFGTIVGGEKGVQLFEGGTLTNQSGGTISANQIGVWATGPATVVNAGSITGEDSGVYLSQSYLTNQTTGVIGNGVRMGDGATLLNAGLISGNIAAYLDDNSVLTNQSGGTITGGIGAEVSSAVQPGGGTVVNDGSIAGTGAGVELLVGGSLINQADGTISGAAGVSVNGLPTTYTNSYGVTYVISYTPGRATITNAGLISGQYGVQVYNSFVTVTDSGTIAGSKAAILFAYGYADRLVLDPGASILGKVSGRGGVLELAAGTSAGTLNSLGSQFSGFAQVFVDAGANWVLYGTDTFAAGSTLTNAGTLNGSGGDAVLFAPGDGNFVVVDPGAVFNGPVDGGNPIGGAEVSTLVLASSSTQGVLSGLGSKYIDFTQIIVDPGANWAVTGSNTIVSGQTLSLFDATITDTGTLVNNGVITLDPSTMTVAALTGTGSVTITSGSTLEVQGTISSGETIVFTGTSGLLILDDPDAVAGGVMQMSPGNYLDLHGISPTSVAFNAGNLDFTGGSFPLTFAGGGGFEPASSDGDGGALVGAICFCIGACIATPSGEVPVQHLAVGDMVLTAGGAARPIVWIGVGHALARRGRRGDTTPVIVRKGALADNVPNRDLRVTKGHSFLLDGVLIPVEFLVNHCSILWDDLAQTVTIYHIELATHDILLANGAPAESYRDDGNRRLFQNANSGWDLPPKPPCAPVLTGGPEVDAAWLRLVERAGRRPGLPLTDDPDLHLVVDGRRLDAVAQRPSSRVFRLATPLGSVRLVSRAAAPQEPGLARDPRVLGVAVRRIVSIHGARQLMAEADDASLTEGFHPCETEAGSSARFRWTDGDALLPPALFAGFDGPFNLEVYLAATVHYIAGCASHRAA